MSKERNVDVFPVAKVGHSERRDDGSVIVTFLHSDGLEVGLLLPPEAADELTGALIHLPQSKFGELAAGSELGSEYDVTEHEVRQVDEDAYTFRIASEGGGSLSFRLGTRRLRRIRDMMTAHLVQHEARHKQ